MSTTAKRAHHTPLKAVYLSGPQFALDGWQIKTDDDIEVTIAVVPETIGGRKDKNGRSPRQTTYANLFKTAPDLLASCESLVNVLAGLDEKSLVDIYMPEVLTIIDIAKSDIAKAKSQRRKKT